MQFVGHSNIALEIRITIECRSCAIQNILLILPFVGTVLLEYDNNAISKKCTLRNIFMLSPALGLRGLELQSNLDDISRPFLALPVKSSRCLFCPL